VTGVRPFIIRPGFRVHPPNPSSPPSREQCRLTADRTGPPGSPRVGSHALDRRAHQHGPWAAPEIARTLDSQPLALDRIHPAVVAFACQRASR
jgi:hypothetical protein